MSDQPRGLPDVDDLPEQMRVRREKLDRLRAEGRDPYAFGFPRTATNAELQERFAGLDPDTATGERAGVVGRVVLNRVSGKIIFATLRDGTGDLQVMAHAGQCRPGAAGPLEVRRRPGRQRGRRGRGHHLPTG